MNPGSHNEEALPCVRGVVLPVSSSPYPQMAQERVLAVGRSAPLATFVKNRLGRHARSIRNALVHGSYGMYVATIHLAAVEGSGEAKESSRSSVSAPN